MRGPVTDGPETNTKVRFQLANSSTLANYTQQCNCRQPTPMNIHPLPISVPRFQTQNRQSLSPNTKWTKVEEQQEFFVERIINHGINDYQEHQSAGVREIMYWVRWYGFNCEDDPFKHMGHIPRGEIVSCYKRIRCPLLDNLNEAQK